MFTAVRRILWLAQLAAATMAWAAPHKVRVSDADLAKEMMAQQAVSVNATEGFTAFLAKRDPVWNDDTF